MAEVIGIAASAVTLAALFSKCIDCFSYFKAAQNCTAEAETLLVKLDCEKARLLVWANTVGILHTDDQGRYPQLADSEQEMLIRRCIDQIISLLTDAQALQAEYGGYPADQQETQRSFAVVSVNSMNIFMTTKRRFFARAGGLNQAPSWLTRIKWAIRDGAKFRILISHLKDFVDDIIMLVPVPPEVINNTVEEDITKIIDISTLRLAESACEESYPSWSTRASEVIKESELGTLDPRNLEEISEDMDQPEIAQNGSGLNADRDLHRGWGLQQKTFLILTDKCLDLEADSHCESARIGESITGSKGISFACPHTARWNLGRRVLANVQLTFLEKEQMSQMEAIRLETSKLDYTLPKIRPVSRIYIHCGPCACAIQTAMEFTLENDVSEYFDLVIRIDERLQTSCRRSSTTIDVLAAIRNAIAGHVVQESSDKSRSLGCIDCPELEKHMYNLERERSRYREATTVLQRILLEDYSVFRSNLPIGAIVIIAEANLCHLSLESRPFYTEAKKPQETDIFSIKPLFTSSAWTWHREYAGSYTRSKNAIEKKRAESSLLTDRAPPPTSSITATKPTNLHNKRPRSESTAESTS